MTRTRARVTVRLKPAILDPQGRAVQATLRRLGYDDVDGVRIGKIVEFELPGPPGDAAYATVRRIAEQVLAQPVMEDVEIDLEAVPDDADPSFSDAVAAQAADDG
ncbi:MAG: phosphoribosylformylglycinamidine synthase subunit PurS [Trueperaceae bacterium]